MKYHLTPIIQKTKNNKCWQECEGKETLVHSWWERKLMQILWKTAWGFLKKLKIDQLYDPAVSLLGIYLKKMKTLTPKDMCTPMFTVALFIITMIYKQPKCSSTNEWVKVCVCVCVCVYSHNGMLFSHKN